MCRELAEELRLEPDAPGGMVDFRRTLTLSFFFKFYLTVLQKLGKVNPEDVSVGREAGLVGNLLPLLVFWGQKSRNQGFSPGAMARGAGCCGQDLSTCPAAVIT